MFYKYNTMYVLYLSVVYICIRALINENNYIKIPYSDYDIFSKQRRPLTCLNKSYQHQINNLCVCTRISNSP